MQFAPTTLVFDIASTAITTMFIPKSHRTDIDLSTSKSAVSLSTHHNAVLFNCFIQHQGAASVAAACKMALTFIPQWQDDEERECYGIHSYSFGVSDKYDKLKGTLLPLIPLRR